MQGFDEYMNLVLDEAEEVSMKRKARKPIGAQPTASYMQRCWRTHTLPLVLKCVLLAGRILLKGDNITLMQTT